MMKMMLVFWGLTRMVLEGQLIAPFLAGIVSIP